MTAPLRTWVHGPFVLVEQPHTGEIAITERGVMLGTECAPDLETAASLCEWMLRKRRQQGHADTPLEAA